MTIDRSVNYYENYLLDMMSVLERAVNREEACVQDFTCSLFQKIEDIRAQPKKIPESVKQLATNMEFYEFVCAFMGKNTSMQIIKIYQKIHPHLEEMTERLKDYKA